MPLIRKDELGLYCYSGGYIARPFKTTSLKEGDKPKARHHCGSTFHTVGGETWMGCGDSLRDKTPEQRRQMRDWYFNYNKHLVEIEWDTFDDSNQATTRQPSAQRKWRRSSSSSGQEQRQ